MHRLLLGSWSYAVCIALLALPSAKATEDPKHLQITRLKTGLIEAESLPFSGSNVEWGRATGIVKAPVETVRSVITNYGEYANFLPHFEKSKVLSQRGDNAMLYLQASVLKNTHTMWAQMNIYRRKTTDNALVIEGKMLQGNLDRFVARWELTPVDQGQATLVSFQLLVEPDLPIPASILSSHNRSAAKRTIEALRRRVADLTVQR